MTRGLDKAFGLPSLADLMRENSIDGEDLPDPAETGVELFPIETIDPLDTMETGDVALPVATADHDRAMDTIYNEALKLGRDVADAGFQADMPRMPRFFEVANALFKTAGDMATSKQEHKLRATKMGIELRRLELAEKQASGTGINANTTEVEGVMVVDRNEIIAARIAARKKEAEGSGD